MGLAPVQFTKMHGLGNDFILVDAVSRSLPEDRLPELAQQWCDRHFGIGADGLILALPSAIADFRMRIFNADGSEAEMCGNGVRCFACFVQQAGLTTADEIAIDTLAGIIRPRLLAGEAQVQVDMGEPRLDRHSIPVGGEGERAVGDRLVADGRCYEFTAVSMGNPHCVVFVSNAQETPVELVGPKIETHPLFPRKTNVEFVQVYANDHIRMRVWERGCGETLACGTGACAAVVASSLNGLTGRQVRVDLNGGPLRIEWAESGRVLMTGPAVEVFTGETALD